MKSVDISVEVIEKDILVFKRRIKKAREKLDDLPTTAKTFQERKKLKIQKSSLEKEIRHVDNRDPGISLKALDQSWKLDGAYIDRHVHHYPDINEIDAELVSIDEERKRLEAELGVEIVEGEVEN